MSLTTPGQTRLDGVEAAIRGQGDYVCGIDVHGSSAVACLVAASKPLEPTWHHLDAKTRGLRASREIGLQALQLFTGPTGRATSAVVIETAFSNYPSSTKALNRTIGAIAVGLPYDAELHELSAGAWRKALGIHGGKGSKERATAWAEHELDRALSSHQADSYGIARAILAKREKGTR